MSRSGWGFFLDRFRLLRIHISPWIQCKGVGFTLVLGFAACFGPNASLNAVSTAFLISKGLAQRNAGEFRMDVMTEPNLSHPAIAFEVIYSLTWTSNSSEVMVNPGINYPVNPCGGINISSRTNTTLSVEIHIIYRHTMRFNILYSN